MDELLARFSGRSGTEIGQTWVDDEGLYPTAVQDYVLPYWRIDVAAWRFTRVTAQACL